MKTIDPIDVYNYLTRRMAKAEREMYAARKAGDQLLENWYRGKFSEANRIRRYYWEGRK